MTPAALLELPPYVDGQLIAWLGGLAVSCAVGLILMYFRQRRLWRSMFGDTDDETRPGIRKKQEESRDQIMAELDDLRTHVDSQFTQLEERMTYRHDELSFAIARIIQQMDNPPEDVNPYGPWHSDDASDKYDGDGQPPEHHADGHDESSDCD